VQYGSLNNMRLIIVLWFCTRRIIVIISVIFWSVILH